MYQDKKKPPKTGGLIGFSSLLKNLNPLNQKNAILRNIFLKLKEIKRPWRARHPPNHPVASCHPVE